MKSHPITESSGTELSGTELSGTRDASRGGLAQARTAKPSRLREAALLLIALAFIGGGIWMWGPGRVEPTLRLRICAGEKGSARFQVVSKLADHLRKDRIELEVIPSEGSEDSLTRLNVGAIDLALVQGGLNLGERTQVRQLAALQLEPLHVLVKRELVDFIHEKGLTALRGKRVFAGSPSSGTHVLAVNLFDFIGVNTHSAGDPNSVILSDEPSYRELLTSSQDALPDAIFHVSIVPSPIASQLVHQKGYRLVEVPYARAFAESGAIDVDGPESDQTVQSERLELNRALVLQCTIPTYTYGVSPDVPDRDLLTVGSHMLLVARSDQTNESVNRLLSAVFDSDTARHTGLELDPKTLDLPSEYEPHPGVELYRNRNKVLIARDLIDYMENLLGITATIAGAVFFFYQWFSEHRRSQRESRFAEFMTRVIAIEQSALSTEVASKLDLAKLIRMQRELANLKAEAVRGFAAGEWHGTHMLNGLLALINDTREQLTRLILHERENIEQSAAAQQVDLEALWRAEATGWEEK